MSSRKRWLNPAPLSTAAIAAIVAALGLSACGGGGKGASEASGPASATVLDSSAPDSLDPQVGLTTTSMQATWNVYLGLYTYAHANGPTGTHLIPALAAEPPKVSAGDTVYTMTLRKGLRFSNGAAVKASDFTHSIERAIRLNWGGKSFLTEHIVGAEAFDEHKASTISGIATDDGSGKITIRLTSPYGAFLNILAFPAAGLVPSSTPMKAEPNDPPPGVGPYEIEHVIPGRSFEEAINPHWAKQAIPGIPTPKLTIDVKVQSNLGAEADEVLANEADLFDWGTPLPPAAVRQAKREASDRYSVQPVAQVSYFFLNVTKPPFNNVKAREAAVEALNRPAFTRLASGYLTPGCYLLPPGLIGHPSSPCPYGDPSSTGNVKKAKQLVQQSGTAGEEVTVWGPAETPHREFVDNFAQTLDAIGYKAKEKVISPSAYYGTVTNVKTGAQVGFSEYAQDFPNPVDFYQLIDGDFIQPEGNHDMSLARDPAIDDGVKELAKLPASELPKVAARWEALERHAAKEAYVAVIGYQDAPKLTSERIDFGALVFSPVYGPDWTTLKLK